ncbi:hypothetical protein EJ07DRAFT_153563 [Lizonia empirigonia]|nr:hypothetical protein EJ07DRAFT_153563 [Lizonia empirigonia]
MVTWDATKDQTLLKGIFAFHNIKNSAPLLKYLADQIGEGCTPKAVGHRLTNLRNSGKMVNSNGSSVTPKKSVATPKTPRTPKTPASRKACVNLQASKKTSDIDSSSEDDQSVASPVIGRKRARIVKAPATYAESDDASDDDDDEEEFKPMSKRVKAEPIEDEDLTSMTTGNDGFEKDDEAVSFV